MTRDEAKHLVMMVSAAYPNWKPLNLTETVDTWAVMLEEFDHDECLAALKSYILTDTSGFAPGIGQVIDRLQRRREGRELGELDAWSMVSKALHGMPRTLLKKNLPPCLRCFRGRWEIQTI